MPVGAGTVPEPVEEPEANPRENRQRYDDEVEAPGFPKRPSCQVEDDQGGVEDREGYVSDSEDCSRFQVPGSKFQDSGSKFQVPSSRFFYSLRRCLVIAKVANERTDFESKRLTVAVASVELLV